MFTYFKKVTLFVSFFVLLTASSFSAIFPCNSTKEILPYVEKGTLVIFDIDNTIYTNKQMLGGDTWFYDTALHLGENRYISTKEELIALYTELQKKSSARIVESITPCVIQDINRMGCPVMALTSRDKGLACATLRQMNEVGVSFFPPRIADASFEFTHPYGWNHGVFFTSGSNKGVALLYFLEKSQIHSEKIVMIDDQKKHLEAVSKALESIAIPFIGLHYIKSLEISEAYDQTVAEVELDRYLKDGTILSDDEARAFLSEVCAE